MHAVGGREFDFRADSLTSNPQTGLITASGNVSIHEIDTSIFGKSFTFDRNARQGVIMDSLLNYPPFYIASAETLLSPSRVVATNATITTSPPTLRPEFHVTAGSVVLNPVSQRITFRNAKFYVYGTRVFTLRKYSQRTSPNPNQNAINQTLRPSFGYDNQRGPYAVIARNLGTERFPISASFLVPTKRDPSASLSSSATILLNKNANHPVTQVGGLPASNPNDPVAQIRGFASNPGEPLPNGDPLLFHDFLGSDRSESVLNAPVTPDLQPGATLSYREPLYGRRIGNLSYSKLPEGALRLDLPLYGQGRIATDRNPEDVRRSLRSLYLFAYANTAVGYYREYPTHVESDRSAASFTLDTRPLLVGENLLFRPTVRFYEAQYVSMHSHYGYQQVNASLQRSYNEYTALGVEYIYTAQHGHDPFVFDSVDTTQEVDLSGQTGIGHDILGTRIKLDLNRKSLYDYQIDYSFPQRSFIPTIIYDNLSKSIGFGFNIQGVNF